MRINSTNLRQFEGGDVVKQGDNYLTQTQPVREIKNKGTRNIRRTYVNILLKEGA